MTTLYDGTRVFSGMTLVHRYIHEMALSKALVTLIITISRFSLEREISLRTRTLSQTAKAVRFGGENIVSQEVLDDESHQLNVSVNPKNADVDMEFTGRQAGMTLRDRCCTKPFLGKAARKSFSL